MRLYPPGVFLIREPLTEDFHLQECTIPKGTWIHVSFPELRYLASTRCNLVVRPFVRSERARS